MAGEMAFLYAMPSGVAGSVSRPLDSEVDTIELGSTPPTAYGVPVVNDGTGKFNKVSGSTVATDIQGFIVRSVPAITGAIANGFDDNVPNTTMPQAMLKHGYIKVICAVGTPVKGKPVYVRVVAATGKAIGDLEATADGSNNIAITGAEFAVNGKDANNVCEIRYTI